MGSRTWTRPTAVLAQSVWRSRSAGPRGPGASVGTMSPCSTWSFMARSHPAHRVSSARIRPSRHCSAGISSAPKRPRRGLHPPRLRRRPLPTGPGRARPERQYRTRTRSRKLADQAACGSRYQRGSNTPDEAAAVIINLLLARPPSMGGTRASASASARSPLSATMGQ